jgi:hypothetical protein
MIVENPLLNLTTKTIETTPAVILTFKRSEFAFGQYSTKKMDPKVLKEPDLLRHLAYCRLKVAALAQAQGYKDANQAKLNDDDLLEKKAQKDIQIARILLKKVAESFKDNHQVQQICANNMSYLNEDFNAIIKTYQEDLNVQQKNSLCG